MRTDDSFYQETYINANVNGVRPYWKNLKVREFLIAVFVFDTRGGGKSETEKKKTHAPGGDFFNNKKRQLYFEYTYQPFGLKIPQTAIDLISNNTFTVRESFFSCSSSSFFLEL